MGADVLALEQHLVCPDEDHVGNYFFSASDLFFIFLALLLLETALDALSELLLHKSFVGVTAKLL